MVNKEENTEIKKIEDAASQKAKSKTTSVVVKVAIANILNAVLVVAIVVLLGNLPDVAEKIKELRSAHLVAQGSSDAALIHADIDKNQEKVDKLLNLYIDDDGFADFLSAVSVLRADSTITEVTFPGSEEAISGTTQTGVPVLIVFQGTKDAVDSALSKVLALPFMISPEFVEVEGDANALTLKFGAMLLTNENFSKN